MKSIVLFGVLPKQWKSSGWRLIPKGSLPKNGKISWLPGYPLSLAGSYKRLISWQLVHGSRFPDAQWGWCIFLHENPSKTLSQMWAKTYLVKNHFNKLEYPKLYFCCQLYYLGFSDALLKFNACGCVSGTTFSTYGARYAPRQNGWHDDVSHLNHVILNLALRFPRRSYRTFWVFCDLRYIWLILSGSHGCPEKQHRYWSRGNSLKAVQFLSIFSIILRFAFGSNAIW